jgi:hypothetical protein
LFFLLFLLLLLLYCLPSWSHSNPRMKERNSLCSLRFFSLLTACLSRVFFLSFFICFFSALSFFFSFHHVIRGAYI